MKTGPLNGKLYTYVAMQSYSKAHEMYKRSDIDLAIV